MLIKLYYRNNSILANHSDNSAAEGTTNPTVSEEPDTDERGFVVWPNQQGANNSGDQVESVGSGGGSGADSAQAQRAVAALSADSNDVQVRVVQPQQRPERQRSASQETDEERKWIT